MLLRSASCSLLIACVAYAAPDGFAHVQLERGSLRVGETLWYRVHGDLADASLSLVDPSGNARLTRALPKAARGSLYLDPSWPGGRYHLEVRRGTELLHRAPCEVFDLRRRELDLSLRVLGEFVYPGETLGAAIFARTLKGAPIAGARLRYRAQLGAVVLEGHSPPTDEEGGVVLRLPIPAHVLDSGTLSVALEHDGKREALARPVIVSGSVGDVEAFVEGGAVVPGKPHRVVLLVRDQDGQATPAEGRLIDDRGRCVDVVVADRFGQAVVVAPYKEGRSYQVQIDRPAGVERRFALPAASGHAHALRLEPAAGGLLRAWVWGAKAKLELLLLREGEVVQRSRVRLRSADRLVSVDFGRVQGYCVDEVVLVHGGRAVARAATVRGTRWPVDVRVRPVAGSSARGVVVLEVETRDLQGDPVAADLALSVARAGFEAAPQLPARDLLAPFLVGAATPHALSDLFVPGADERRDAFLLTRAAWAYPPEGVELVKGAVPARDVARRVTRTIPRRERRLPPAETRARGTSELDGLLARAPFTRPLESVEPDASFGRRDRPALPPQAKRAAKRPPQRTKVPARVADQRRGLCWEGRVKTGRKGRAHVRFRLGDDCSQLVAHVEGYAGALAVGGSGETRAHEEFGAELDFPTHLRVGDRVEAFVEVSASGAPLELAVRAPRCLKPLDRMRRVHRPGKDAERAKFRFEVIAPAKRATIEVRTQRGVFEHRAQHAFSVSERELTLSFGASATSTQGQALTLDVPTAALPGSVQVLASVSPFVQSPPPVPLPGGELSGEVPSPGMVLDDLGSMLREPTGCFSQTTSANWPNLAVLDTLLETGVDAHALERAYDLADAGYRRILTFQRPDGGFGLYPGDASSPTYTTMAVPQLAAYARLFRGRGSQRLQRALAYLDKVELDEWSRLRLVTALHEAGRTHRLAEKVLSLKPSTSYQRALLIQCLEDWPCGEAREQARAKKGVVLEHAPRCDPDACARRASRLEHELDALCQEQDASGLFPSTGEGLMGSRGSQLDMETTALAVPALVASGRKEQAQLALVGLAARRKGRGGWGSTRTTCLVVRALAYVADLESYTTTLAVERMLREQAPPIPVTFSCAGTTKEALVGGRRDRSRSFEGPHTLRPGQRVEVSLSAEGERKLIYGVACSYRVASPKSAPDAPYRLAVSLPESPTHLGAGPLSLSVSITRTAAPIGEGQVVAKIAIPGGLRLGELDQAALGCGRVDVENGALVIYWATPRDVPSHLSIPVEPAIAGTYASPPSMIYPYYEANREAYTQAGTLRIDAAYDEMGGEAKLGGLIQGAGGR